MDNILFRNDQWAIVESSGKVFISEMRSKNHDDFCAGFEFLLQDLESMKDGNYSEIDHICSKTWVDIDQFEEAVTYASRNGLISPTYDMEPWFSRAKSYREAGGARCDHA